MPPLPDSMHTTARKIYEWYESQKEVVSASFLVE
jgi:hypothetical protein